MDISQEFTRLFGLAPEVIAQAPGRVNLIGEHIDYSEGFVLPFAIDSITTAAINKRSDNQVRVTSAQQSGNVVTTDLSRIAQKSGEGGCATFWELSGRWISITA